MAKIEALTDPEDLAAIVEDVRRGVQFIRAAQGYGEVVVRVVVRPGGFVEWDVSPKFTRRPRRDQPPVKG